MLMQQEIKAFKRELPRLLAEDHEGEFVVLKSCVIQQICPTYEDALTWAYENYGLDDEFFVKQVLNTSQQVIHFRRAQQGRE